MLLWAFIFFRVLMKRKPSRWLLWVWATMSTLIQCPLNILFFWWSSIRIGIHWKKRKMQSVIVDFLICFLLCFHSFIFLMFSFTLLAHISLYAHSICFSFIFWSCRRCIFFTEKSRKKIFIHTYMEYTVSLYRISASIGYNNKNTPNIFIMCRITWEQ